MTQLFFIEIAGFETSLPGRISLLKIQCPFRHPDAIGR